MLTIRRTEIVDDQWREVLQRLTSERIHVSSVEFQEITPLIENYAFENQEICIIRFEYEESSHPFDSSINRTVPCTFTIRSDSNLFTLEIESDTPPVSVVVDEIRSAIGEGIQIYPGLKISRESILGFIKRADERIQINVIVEEKREDIDKIDHLDMADLHKNDIIESARIAFNYNEENINVIYNGDSLSVINDSEEANEYVLQVFEQSLEEGL